MAGKSVESVYSHWKPLTQADYNALMLDFEKFCEEGSMVTNKNGVPVPFIPNEAQRVVANAIIKEVFAEIPRPYNLFIHKCRQMGISVIIAKVEQYICSRIRNINAQHIMPVEADADDLCDMKFVPLLQGTHPDLLPTTSVIKRRVKFLEVDNVKLNSSVTFTSAENRSGNRGQTNQVLIEDEHAHYTNVTYLERGVLATLPRVGRALRVVVSTAYGMNHFYDLSKVAKNSTHWGYMFLPWHMLKEYEREPEGRLLELTRLTEYEVKLCGIFQEEGYPIQTWARKLQWWNYTYETEAKMDIEYMYENYPSTPDESFAATGAPVLPAAIIREFKENPRPFKTVELTEDNQGKRYIRETALSKMRQFRPPVKGRKYLMSIDPSEGGAGGDNSAIVVVDEKTLEEVFSYTDKIEEVELAELADVLGRLYNNAMIIVERNTGKTIIEWLLMLKYPRVYVDPFNSTKTRAVFGVYMTHPAKREAISRLKFLLNSGNYKSWDPDFLDEALHFVWKKTPSGLNKAIGSDGYADDSVMSRLILVFTLNMSRFSGYNNDRNET